MSVPRLHDVSLAVCPLTLARKDKGIYVGRSVATGFLWLEEDRWYLITNWHNVTGLNPDTGDAIGSFCPTCVEISLKIPVAEPDGRTVVASAILTVDLFEDEQPIWLEHPTRHLVDCVAVPFPELSEPLISRALNKADFVRDYRPSVGDDCFIVGYPKGLSGYAQTPIWKRASIATEPDFDHEHRAILLVDTATREGMSGSPVIVRHSGLYQRQAIPSHDDIIGTVENFLGIYSGRIGDDPLGVQLGRVWKAHTVLEIIAAKLVGLHPLDVRVERSPS